MKRVPNVKETCEWAHEKYKEKMKAVTTRQYLLSGLRCSLTGDNCRMWKANCKQCIVAKKYNAKLVVGLSLF